MSTVRGEWWIDDRGESHFADGDTGDVNHEMLAYCGALGLPLPGDTEDYDGPEFDVGQQLTPELISYLRDRGAPKDAIAFFSQPHQDAREFMLLYRNWIRVKGDNFEVGKFNADALRRIRNFEGWDDDAEDSDGAVWIEERAGEPVWLANEGRWSDQGWYGKVPVRALLGEATVAELRAEYGARQNPRRRARRNPRGRCDKCGGTDDVRDNYIGKRKGKSVYERECRACRTARARREENAVERFMRAPPAVSPDDVPAEVSERPDGSLLIRRNPSSLDSHFVNTELLVDEVSAVEPDLTHVDPSAPERRRERYAKYPGRRWWADGLIVRIDADNVLFMEGNEWNTPHAAGVMEYMRQGERFEVPAARVYRITAEDVRRTRKAAQEGRLEEDYGMTRPWERAGGYYAQLLDGNHRAAAAMALGDREIWVYVGEDYRKNVRKADWE